MKQSLSHFLPREPRRIGDYDWFYIEARGICFIHQVQGDKHITQTDEINIPWRYIEKALKDFRAAKEKQEKRYDS